MYVWRLLGAGLQRCAYVADLRASQSVLPTCGCERLFCVSVLRPPFTDGVLSLPQSQPRPSPPTKFAQSSRYPLPIMRRGPRRAARQRFLDSTEASVPSFVWVSLVTTTKRSR